MVLAFVAFGMTTTYLKFVMQAINVEGLSLDKFLEHQVNNNGWALEKGGKVHSLIKFLACIFVGLGLLLLLQ